MPYRILIAAILTVAFVGSKAVADQSDYENSNGWWGLGEGGKVRFAVTHLTDEGRKAISFFEPTRYETDRDYWKRQSARADWNGENLKLGSKCIRYPSQWYCWQKIVPLPGQRANACTGEFAFTKFRISVKFNNRVAARGMVVNDEVPPCKRVEINKRTCELMACNGYFDAELSLYYDDIDDL